MQAATHDETRDAAVVSATATPLARLSNAHSRHVAGRAHPFSRHILTIIRVSDTRRRGPARRMDRCRPRRRRYGHSVTGTEQGVAELLDAYLDAQHDATDESARAAAPAPG